MTIYQGEPEFRIATDEEVSSHESENDMTESSPVKKNKSNFKSLSQALKEERQARKELAARLSKLEGNPEEEEEAPIARPQDDLALDIFLLRNPEAERYMDEILARKARVPDDSYKDAWQYVKGGLEVSKSKDDYDFSSQPKQVQRKKIQDITAEEALRLSKPEQAAWRKYHLKLQD